MYIRNKKREIFTLRSLKTIIKKVTLLQQKPTGVCQDE